MLPPSWIGNIEVRSANPRLFCEETPILWCTGSSAVNSYNPNGLHQIRGQLEVLDPIPGMNHAVAGHYLLPGEDSMVLGGSMTMGILIQPSEMTLPEPWSWCTQLPGVPKRARRADKAPSGFTGSFASAGARSPRARLVQSGPWITRPRPDHFWGPTWPIAWRCTRVLPSVYAKRLRVERFES